MTRGRSEQVRQLYARRRQVIAGLAPVVAVLLALAVGGVLIWATGVSPLAAYAALLRGAIGSRNNVAETLVKTAPLLLAGLGVAVAFRARVFNIGAEGQIYLGALGAGFVGLFLGELPSVVGIPLVLLAGFVLGALWAGLAGVLKVRLRANEIIVTLMLNFIGIELVNYLISGPWRDPQATEPFTRKIAAGTQLPVLLPATRLHLGILVAVAAAFILWWVLSQTTFGYQLTLLGASESAAQYAGIHTGRLVLLTMLISGGLAGLAGAGEVAGLHGRVIEGLSPGYGFTAIVIAVLGKQRPMGVLAASLLFAVLTVGADGMHRSTGVPVSVVLLIEGLVLLFVIGSEAWQQRMRRIPIGLEQEQHATF